jgi:putative Mg2+ transporter-C (MgtC) family protein
VVGVNLLLRALVSQINRQPIESAAAETSYIVTVVCRSAAEAHVRALLLQGLTTVSLEYA